VPGAPTKPPTKRSDRRQKSQSIRRTLLVCLRPDRQVVEDRCDAVVTVSTEFERKRRRRDQTQQLRRPEAKRIVSCATKKYEGPFCPTSQRGVGARSTSAHDYRPAPCARRLFPPTQTCAGRDRWASRAISTISRMTDVEKIDQADLTATARKGHPPCSTRTRPRRFGRQSKAASGTRRNAQARTARRLYFD